MNDALGAWLPEGLAWGVAALLFALSRGRALAGRAADVALLACAAIAVAAVLALDAPDASILGGHLVIDRFAAAARFVVALGAVVVAWIATLSRSRAADDGAAWAAFFASMGGLFAMTTAASVAAAWTATEVAAVGAALWIGGSAGGSAADAPAPRGGARVGAGLLVESRFASAFSLLGAGLLAVLAGTTHEATLAGRLSAALAAPGGRAVIDAAFVLLLAGFGRALGLVPWQAPRARDAARHGDGEALWLHAALPVAATALLARLLRTTMSTVDADGSWQALPGLGWPDLLAAAAAATMLAGNVAAVRETDLRRIVAWLATVQAGFLAAALATAGDAGVEAAAVHAVASAVALSGALLATTFVEEATGSAGVEAVRGLLRRGRAGLVLAAPLLLFVASLVAVPPLAGHAGRAAVFECLVATSPLLALAAAVASLAGLLALVRLVATMVDRPDGPAPGAAPGFDASLLAAVLAAAVVALGVLPGPAADFAGRAVAFFGG